MSTTYVHDVVALRQFKAPTNNAAVYVRGTVNAADELGGMWCWAVGSTAADDGATIIKVANVTQGRWLKAVAASSGPTFGNISKVFTFSDFTAAAGDQAIAFDGPIPAGATVVQIEANVSTAFEGGAITKVNVEVHNSNITPSTSSAMPIKDFIIGEAADVAYVGAFGNILAGDTPVAIFDPSGANLDACTQGSVTITIHYLTP